MRRSCWASEPPPIWVRGRQARIRFFQLEFRAFVEPMGPLLDRVWPCVRGDDEHLSVFGAWGAVCRTRSLAVA